MGPENQNGNQGHGWTPEQILQAGKEIVTALLGVILVSYTLYLASKAFGYAGDPTKMTDAKDILTLMLGLAGVVVGYYFGRVPADARATQAQDQANTATAQAEQVSTQAKSAADQVDQVLAQLTTPAGGGARGTVTDAVVEEMTRVRNTLRQVSSAAH